MACGPYGTSCKDDRQSGRLEGQLSEQEAAGGPQELLTEISQELVPGLRTPDEVLMDLGATACVAI